MRRVPLRAIPVRDRWPWKEKPTKGLAYVLNRDRAAFGFNPGRLFFPCRRDCAFLLLSAFALALLTPPPRTLNP